MVSTKTKQQDQDDMIVRLQSIEEEGSKRTSCYIQATLRTDTLLDKLDRCHGRDIGETIEIVVQRSGNMDNGNPHYSILHCVLAVNDGQR